MRKSFSTLISLSAPLKQPLTSFEYNGVDGSGYEYSEYNPAGDTYWAGDVADPASDPSVCIPQYRPNEKFKVKIHRPLSQAVVAIQVTPTSCSDWRSPNKYLAKQLRTVQSLSSPTAVVRMALPPVLNIPEALPSNSMVVSKNGKARSPLTITTSKCPRASIPTTSPMSAVTGSSQRTTSLTLSLANVKADQAVTTDGSPAILGLLLTEIISTSLMENGPSPLHSSIKLSSSTHTHS